MYKDEHFAGTPISQLPSRKGGNKDIKDQPIPNDNQANINYMPVKKKSKPKEEDILFDDIDFDDEPVLSKIPQQWRDPLIILVSYVILSHPSVRDSITAHVKMLNPDNEGNIAFGGIVIYGSILALLFVLIKTVLLKYKLL
jgi:hypothetical protein